MSVKNKMDTLDFIIKILLEHEKKLDVLVERLEYNAQYIEDIIKRIELNDHYEAENKKN